MTRKPTKYPNRTLSKVLTDPLGREVVKFETLPLQTGQTIRLVFEQVNSPWRQGVWLGTNGSLEAAGTTASQIVLWSDTAPPEAEIHCLESDGLLRLYNVWNRGVIGGHDSLGYTSGMVVDELADGWRRYSCTDMGKEPDFGKLVFRVCIV